MTPTAGQVRAHLRALNRARDPRSTLRRLFDAHDQVFNVIMVGGLATGAARVGLNSSDAARPPGAVPVELLRWLVVPLAVLVLAVMLKGLLTLGPLLIRSAAQTWLFSSPVDRRSLLARRFAWLVAAGALSGAAFATAAAIAARLPTPTLPAVLAAGLAVGVLVVCVAVRVQPDRIRVRAVQRGLTVVGMVCTVAVTVVALLGSRRGLPSMLGVGVASWPVATGVIALAALAVLITLAAWRALSRLDRAALSTGAEVAEATSAAMNWLDPTLLSATLLQRRIRAITGVRSARIRGRRMTALLLAEWVRLRRLRHGLIVWVALLPLPYVTQAALPAVTVAPVQLVAAYLATDRLAGGLRLISRSAALRRALGGTDRHLRLTHLITPSVGSALWCALTAPALPHAMLVSAALSAVGAVAVSYRIATRPPMDYSTAMADTPMGTMPVGLVLQGARGLALLVVLVFVQVLIGRAS